MSLLGTIAKEEFVKTARACFAPVLWPVWLFKHLRAALKDRQEGRGS